VNARYVRPGAAAGLALLLGAGAWAYALQRADRRPIRVGILHSLTGSMAISEGSVAQATQMALDEVNASGGLLGRPVQAVQVDGRSDWPTFARQAERLIAQERVSTVFGCWTSASRKTVRPVFEKHDHLLIYPVQYEGLEQSPNIVYTGAAPNQQIIPGVKWAVDHLGKRVFLVGSDYVFPRTANAIIRDLMVALRGTVVGEEYLLLGSKDVAATVARIRAVRPDVILNTINGDTNVAFFHALRAAGVTPARIPTMSFSLAEDELRVMGAGEMVGDYAAWNYFQSLPGDANRRFVERFRARYGRDRVTSDPMEAAYFGVHVWAQAVRDAGTDDVRAIRRAIRRQSYAAPEGIVYVDPETQHTWKYVRIGRIRGDGQFDVAWSSDKPVRPVPFPVLRTRGEWEAFLDGLFTRWHGRWANPGTGS
jgi:urea transport system substrate-binding protein